jgi:hypothetical protein
VKTYYYFESESRAVVAITAKNGAEAREKKLAHGRETGKALDRQPFKIILAN